MLHRERRRAGGLATLLAGLLLIVPILSYAAEQGSGAQADTPAEDKETIVIRADRAWEEPDNDEVLHFAGHFELISPEWELRSSEADLFGPLDDPTRIVARGDPARLTIVDGEDTINGEGGVIEYQRDADILILKEGAKLGGEDISMKSSEIVYDVGAERLRSSGTDGVEMVLERAR
ncbi:MAG: LptA/OstA family protein [Pseudomonadales bacterium]|jgi:lipopolysaccharide transport protein LptA